MLRLDWQLLYEGPVTKFHNEKLLEETLDWLHSHNYVVINLDCSPETTPARIVKSIGETLHFPDYFSGNIIDSFDDFLYRVEIRFNGGLAIALRHFDRVLVSEPILSWQILNTLANHSRRNLIFGLCLIVLVQSDNPKIEIEPVGIRTVSWNQREWMDFQRGIGEAPEWWSNSDWQVSSLSNPEDL